MTPGEAFQASQILFEWNRLRNLVEHRSGDVGLSVRKILEFIGFKINRLGAREDLQGGLRLQIEAELIASRNDCILPDFASRWAGRYQLLCLDGGPLEDEILRIAGTEHPSRPVIVLFFNSMSPRRRRDLAHALRRRSDRRLLFLDYLLLTYLCLQKDRLPAFFNAACQFSIAEPYITTSTIPPEMFFGRNAEITSVFDPNGTNLVYGGRQLGKTALLNEVRRATTLPQASSWSL